jgi:hypothetical protein
VRSDRRSTRTHQNGPPANGGMVSRFTHAEKLPLPPIDGLPALA